jgi:hypothetical protein
MMTPNTSFRLMCVAVCTVFLLNKPTAIGAICLAVALTAACIGAIVETRRDNQ